MDFLNQVWVAWNEQWGATIATILSIIALSMTAGERVHRLTSAIARWRGWGAVAGCLNSLQDKYRIRRTKNIMLAAMKHKYVSVTVGVEEFNRRLIENQSFLSRDTFQGITPEKPSWLDDHYVAAALESLSEERQIVKVTKFHLDSWPPRNRYYVFLRRTNELTAEQQIDEVETESKCLVHQFWDECLYSPRYTAKSHAETIEPGRTNLGTAYWLRADAPPCSRCWDIKSRQSDIRSLVDSVTKYDLSAAATIEITGKGKEFQETVISACIGSHCEAEVATIRKIVEQAIEIRTAQICPLPPESRTEWGEQLTSEFKSKLEAFIGGDSE